MLLIVIYQCPQSQIPPSSGGCLRLATPREEVNEDDRPQARGSCGVRLVSGVLPSRHVTTQCHCEGKTRKCFVAHSTLHYSAVVSLCELYYDLIDLIILAFG